MDTTEKFTLTLVKQIAEELLLFLKTNAKALVLVPIMLIQSVEATASLTKMNVSHYVKTDRWYLDSPVKLLEKNATTVLMNGRIQSAVCPATNMTMLVLPGAHTILLILMPNV